MIDGYPSAHCETAQRQLNKSLQTPLGREAITAHAYTGPGVSELPELYDAHVDSIAVLAFTIEGIEFVDGQMYQQAWHCRPAGNQDPGALEPLRPRAAGLTAVTGARQAASTISRLVGVIRGISRRTSDGVSGLKNTR